MENDGRHISANLSLKRKASHVTSIKYQCLEPGIVHRPVSYGIFFGLQTEEGLIFTAGVWNSGRGIEHRLGSVQERHGRTRILTAVTFHVAFMIDSQPILETLAKSAPPLALHPNGSGQRMTCSRQQQLADSPNILARQDINLDFNLMFRSSLRKHHRSTH